MHRLCSPCLQNVVWCAQICQKLSAEQDGNDEELVISKEAACAMFDKVLEQIIEATKKLLARTEGGCDYILLVGGFAESPYLVKIIREAFSSSVRRKIVRPDVPSQAVLKGEPVSHTEVECTPALCSVKSLMTCACPSCLHIGHAVRKDLHRLLCANRKHLSCLCMAASSLLCLYDSAISICSIERQNA